MGNSPGATELSKKSLKLGVFGFGGDEDGDVGVGVLPLGEEILICRLGLGGVGLHHIGASEAEMGQCANGFIQNNPAMVEDFLELGSGLGALMLGEIGFAAHIHGIHDCTTVNTVSRLS